MAVGLLISCSEPSSGLSGITTVDVGCPALPVGQECPAQPLSARITVTDSQGKIVGRAVSDSGGRFEIDLPPGVYQVQAESTEGSPLPYAEQIPVTVEERETTEVRIRFDSGIR
jgi:hypothetical protein